MSRTVTIADLAAQSAAQPPVSVKIGSLTASGVSQPDAARFSAESIEITDVEIGAAMGPQPALSLTYKVPRITVKDYSGPASLQRPPASSSFVDVYRSVLEQFAGVAATSITAPSLTATINSGVATPGGGEVAYTGLAMQGIKDGKVASTKIDGVVFTVNAQPAGGKPDKLTGNLANIAGYDIDTTAVAAIFDPQKANDDQYLPRLPADHDRSLCRHVRARPEHADRRHDDRRCRPAAVADAIAGSAGADTAARRRAADAGAGARAD